MKLLSLGKEVYKHTLKQRFKRILFNLIVLTCADDIEMNFCLRLYIYVDNSLVVFWKSFLFLPRFLVKNAKNNVFEDRRFLSKMFYQIKTQAATNWSSHLKKHQPFDFFFKRQIFYAIFNNHNFPRFLKIISSTRKNHYMRLILCEHGRQNPTKLV